jgi:hypothetical protein
MRIGSIIATNARDYQVGRIDFGIVDGVERLCLLPEGPRGSLEFPRLALGIRIIRVQQRGDYTGFRYHLP